jgi:hypothetical protein
MAGRFTDLCFSTHKIPTKINILSSNGRSPTHMTAMTRENMGARWRQCFSRMLIVLQQNWEIDTSKNLHLWTDYEYVSQRDSGSYDSQKFKLYPIRQRRSSTRLVFQESPLQLQNVWTPIIKRKDLFLQQERPIRHSLIDYRYIKM